MDGVDVSFSCGTQAKLLKQPSWLFGQPWRTVLAIRSAVNHHSIASHQPMAPYNLPFGLDMSNVDDEGGPWICLLLDRRTNRLC